MWDCSNFWGSTPHMGGFWMFPGMFMFLAFVVIAVLIWRGWVVHGGRGTWSRSGRDETPRQILDRRYASGEITNDQYTAMKRDIEPV